MGATTHVADEAALRAGVRAVCAEAVEAVRRQCRESGRERALALFERCDLADLAEADRPAYATLAAEFHLPETQVANLLAAARRLFRAAMIEVLRARTASDAAPDRRKSRRDVGMRSAEFGMRNEDMARLLV